MTDNLYVHALINAIYTVLGTYKLTLRILYIVIVFGLIYSSVMHHGSMLKVITYRRTAPADRQ